MTTTTTYRDQHAPALAGIFLPGEMPDELFGADHERLRRTQLSMTKCPALEDHPIAAAVYRDMRNKASAAIMALAVVDELMASAFSGR